MGDRRANSSAGDQRANSGNQGDNGETRHVLSAKMSAFLNLTLQKLCSKRSSKKGTFKSKVICQLAAHTAVGRHHQLSTGQHPLESP
uniref:Uncharacterized protein n=1 Tax=Brassica campestris TaxID=3711 RepID=M4FI71_BRACM